MQALSILWSLTGHCYKVRHNNDRSIHPDPSLRWETGAREYNFCTAHNRPPQQQHSITVVCLLFCINHWKNCIVWHRTHSNINSSAKLIAYGRRRRIIHLAYGKKEKKRTKRKTKIKRTEGSNHMYYVCDVGRTRVALIENRWCTNARMRRYDFRILITFCQLLWPYLEIRYCLHDSATGHFLIGCCVCV